MSIGAVALEVATSDGSDLTRILENAKAVFGIDGIRIYLKAENSIHASVGDYRDISGLEEIIFGEEAEKLYGEKDFSQVSVVANIEVIAKDTAKALGAAGIGGYYSCKFKTASGDEARFFFDNIGKKAAFSETQKDIMLLLARVIAGKL